MKRLSIGLFMLTILSYQQAADKLPVVITGQIINTRAADFSIFSKYDVGRAEVIKLEKDGRFETRIDLAEPIEVVCSASRADTGLVFLMYLQPGKNINVSLDAKDRLRSLNFSGDLAVPCKYINYLSTSRIRQEDGRLSDKAVNSANTPADFLRIQDSLLKKRIQVLDSFTFENPGMPEDFIIWEKQRLKYSRLLMRAQYPIRISTSRPGPLTIPNDWFSFLDNPEYKEPAFIQSYFGKQIYKNYITCRSMEKIGISQENSWGNLDFLRANFDLVAGELKIPAIWDVICYEDLLSLIEDKGPEGTDELIEVFNQNSQSQENKDRLAKAVGPWSKIFKGQEAPVFELPDIAGRKFNLKDFHGRYVLLDFWATWCVPCHKEQPYLDSIMGDYQGKNISFISISIDKDLAKWKALVTAEKMKGLHLIDTVEYSREWLVQFVPTYVLIDPAGKIVNSRAAYPSQGMRKLLANQPGL